MIALSPSPTTRPAPRPRPAISHVWGLPLAPLTLSGAVDRVDELIAAGRPSYFITANLHYAMIAAGDSRLARVNAGADFILADGMPLVWASRRGPAPLPQRVAGSDLIFALSERAAERGHRVFLLGGAPGVGEAAARNLTDLYPGLNVVGVAAPPFRPLTAEEHEGLLDAIRAARPDLLLVAFGQPKGESWIAENYRRLGVPVSAQVGASIDFAAGRVPRAPRVLQKTGLEWAYRLYQEPRRLAGRYLRNALFLGRMVLQGPARAAAE